jgi:hypothetical protein
VLLLYIGWAIRGIVIRLVYLSLAYPYLVVTVTPNPPSQAIKVRAKWGETEEREMCLGGPIVSVVIHTDSDGESGSRVRVELGRGMLVVAGREAG